MTIDFKISEYEISLFDLPNGSLFMYGDTIGLKTEYYTPTNIIEAYIVGSGEFFSANRTSSVSDESLMVKELVLIP